MMRRHKAQLWLIPFLLLTLLAGTFSFASAYNGHPKLVVVMIIDQFRGDYLDRGHDDFLAGGFRLLTDKGAWFTDCNYQYATPHTAPGHATLFTGAYSSGHGIQDNEWWDSARKKIVTSVEDETTQIVGPGHEAVGSSPHNLLADTIGDELRLATDGKSRVFTISLKDRSAVLPAGYSGTAYWIDHTTGAWQTSSYYMKALPPWVQAYNQAGHAEAYWNRDWKVGDKIFRRTTKPTQLTERDNWYNIIGATPFANQHQLEFARELIAQEKLGQGSSTDMLVISLSANDILGHRVGPNSEESRSMVRALDRDLADFFSYLGQQFGLGNVWLALSADHGIAPAPSFSKQLKIPGAYLDDEQLRTKLNNDFSTRWGKANYVPKIGWPMIYLNAEAFTAAKVSEADAERMAAEFFNPYGIRGYYTRAQIAAHDVPDNEWGRKFLNSLSPRAGWMVYLVSPPFVVGGTSGTDHAMPYSYDTHVPLAFFGLPFQPGVYRGHCEPTDMAVTLSNLLGINSPTAAVGRVLTEALSHPATTEGAR
jgi:predicted AlkP superfamily pyrophosphatase or phosphodiesterase